MKNIEHAYHSRDIELIFEEFADMVNSHSLSRRLSEWGKSIYCELEENKDLFDEWDNLHGAHGILHDTITDFMHQLHYCNDEKDVMKELINFLDSLKVEDNPDEVDRLNEFSEKSINSAKQIIEGLVNTNEE